MHSWIEGKTGTFCPLQYDAMGKNICKKKKADVV